MSRQPPCADRVGKKIAAMSLWAHAGGSVLAAFLASLVEFAEALTIVLAVGSVRGWRSALIGAITGAGFLAALVLLLGPLIGRVPIGLLQLVVGVLLLLFGMRWLRKAILRAAGVIPLHDELKVFASETAELQAAGPIGRRHLDLDPIALVTTFKAVVLEGIEVVFIVVAIGASGRFLVPAGIGAAFAGVLVIALGLILHRPLAQLPENTLKFAVGVLLSVFGIFWVGEGLRFSWPGGELAIIGLVAALLLAALLSIRLVGGRSEPVLGAHR
jgi:uncharacterized membrane protein